MTYYEDEVPKSLEVGQTYTGKEIEIYQIHNNNVVYLNENEGIADWINYKVIDKKEGFISYSDDRILKSLPNKRIVVEIKKV